MLISVDWFPPSLRPSGACLARGTRVSCSLFTPSRVAPHRGRASADGRSKPRENGCGASTGLALWRQRSLLGHGPQKRTQFPRDGDDHLVGMFPSGTQRSGACAQSSLGLPAAILDRLGHLLQASCRCRRTVAGEREAQAPATSTRRAWLLPVCVMPPCRRRSPVEYAEGVKPRECMSCLGLSKRVRSPRAATVVTATVHGTPRRAWSASTTGASRQVCPGQSVLVPDAPDVQCGR